MNRFFSAAIALVACNTSARAQHAYLPPATYDAMEYTGVPNVTRTDEAGIQVGCRGVPHPTHDGCALVFPGACQIYLIDDNSLKAHGLGPEFVLKHEIAHCLGWPGDHPGARTVMEYLGHLEQCWFET